MSINRASHVTGLNYDRLKGQEKFSWVGRVWMDFVIFTPNI